MGFQSNNVENLAKRMDVIESDKKRLSAQILNKVLVGEGVPSNDEGIEGQFALRVLSDGLYMFAYAKGSWHKVTKCTDYTADGKTLTNLSGAPDEVFDSIDANEIISGAVIWQEFPFIISGGTYNRYYYADIDDGVNGRPYWNDYDTDPTGFSYRDVAGQFVVPEPCTLVEMRGCIANTGGAVNPTVTIYHGTPNEAASDTTLAVAGSAQEVEITTLRVPYKFSQTFSVDIDAGDIVVPTIKHGFSGGTQTYTGNLTLKFLNRKRIS